MLTKLQLQTLQPSDLLNLIKYPLITEKSLQFYSDRCYTFIVDRSLEKAQIKMILENLFQIQIVRINTCILPTKFRRVRKTMGKKNRV
jgi:large subunit ribosomal protein L23